MKNIRWCDGLCASIFHAARPLLGLSYFQALSSYSLSHLQVFFLCLWQQFLLFFVCVCFFSFIWSNLTKSFGIQKAFCVFTIQSLADFDGHHNLGKSKNNLWQLTFALYFVALNIHDMISPQLSLSHIVTLISLFCYYYLWLNFFNLLICCDISF